MSMKHRELRTDLEAKAESADDEPKPEADIDCCLWQDGKDCGGDDCACSHSACPCCHEDCGSE